jgi:serine/threonine-protein kinase PpkA
LYSLGVVLFEMLSGRLPFMGRNLTEILAAHRGEPIPRLREGLHACQPIIDRLLAKNPLDRPADAGQFLEALDSVHIHANRSAS